MKPHGKEKVSMRATVQGCLSTILMKINELSATPVPLVSVMLELHV